MGCPVVTVASGGMPVIDVTATYPKLGLPVTEAANKCGIRVTKVTVGGLPVTFVSAPLLRKNDGRAGGSQAEGVASKADTAEFRTLGASETVRDQRSDGAYGTGRR